MSFCLNRIEIFGLQDEEKFKIKCHCIRHKVNPKHNVKIQHRLDKGENCNHSFNHTCHCNHCHGDVDEILSRDLKKSSLCQRPVKQRGNHIYKYARKQSIDENVNEELCDKNCALQFASAVSGGHCIHVDEKCCKNQCYPNERIKLGVDFLILFAVIDDNYSSHIFKSVRTASCTAVCSSLLPDKMEYCNPCK